MTTITTDPSRALLAVLDGDVTARWNFPAAIGSPVSAPGGIGTAVALTYSFLTAEPSYDAGQIGFQPFTSAQQDAARQAFAAVAAVAGISFTEVAAADGMVALGGNDQDPGLAGYAYYPDYQYSFDTGTNTILSVTASDLGGTVWINTDYAAEDASPGTEAYATLLHEIGHALGLKHPFEASSGDTLSAALDNEARTLMSYTVAPRSLLYDLSGTAASYSYTLRKLSPTSLMSYDIAALQHLYGANGATHGGDTVYGWSVNQELLETIWDGGGVDTIDCSNQILRCMVNLNAGAFSSIGLRQTEAEIRAALDLPDWFTVALDADTYNGSNNLCIAFNCAIENAVGGSAADSLTGNALANTLNGALGDDTLLGAGGADTLIGGSGADSLNGGTGNDRLEGGDGADVYTVDGAGDLIIETATGGMDRVLSGVSYALAPNLEQLALTGSAAITGTGNGLDNLLNGNGAANILKGLAGLDSLTGGAGNDQLFGGAGNDTLTGGNGNDRFVFDSLPGTTNTDRVIDFARGLDKLVLDDDIFSRLGLGLAAGKAIDSAHFKVGSGAADANDYLIYNPATDKLLYDSDGTGPRAPVQVAIIPLAGTMALAATDFLLVV